MGTLKTARLGAVVFAALILSHTDAHAQAACETVVKTDFHNWSYSPSRPASLENGLLSVLANDIIADDEHDRDTASTQILTRRSDEEMTARARVDLLDSLADADTWLFGYAEAGLELFLEARDSTGTLLCSDREEVYIARWNETGTPNDTRSLSCDLPARTAGDQEFITLSVEAHAWITVGGAAGATARMNAQILDVQLEGCSGTCSGSCGGNAGTCFCDSACAAFGDCCADYAPTCSPDSCWEGCGGSAPSGACFCDDLCTSLGDCCTDFADACE